jgi:D-amino-acid dehydrogenase
MAETLVLGAGMVGICTALELQSRGHCVTVADNAPSGSQTSYGNAGIIQSEAVEPYQMPRDLRSLLRIVLGKSNDVAWSLPYLYKQASTLFRYFKESAPERHAEISRSYASLIAPATEDHARWISAAGAEHLISREGLCCVYRDPRELHTQAQDLQRLHDQYGVTTRVLDSAACAAEEPAIIQPVAGAVHWLQPWSCTDPGGLVEAYADLFVKRGGLVVTGDARLLEQNGALWSFKPDRSEVIEAEHVVVALGPWSPDVLIKFGYRIPMILKRGYHAHYQASATLRRPFLDVSHGVVAASMLRGLRVTSGVSLVAHSAPSDPAQLERGAKGLSEILHLGKRIDEPYWFGTRPCMPDMLPMIGASPRHSGLWFNFGHGHQGFTLGPGSAKFLADAMDGDQAKCESAFAPGQRLN